MWIIDLLDENRHREASLCEFSMKYFHFIQEFIDSSNRITHQPTHSRLQASVCERSGSWYQSTESTIASNINRCSLGLPIRWLCEEDELYIHLMARRRWCWISELACVYVNFNANIWRVVWSWYSQVSS